MVADLEEGTLVDGNRTVQIDESLLEKLTFIKEGQFSEIDGAPTLRRIGDVSAVKGHKAAQQFGVLTRDGILAAFLNQTVPENPEGVYPVCAAGWPRRTIASSLFRAPGRLGRRTAQGVHRGWARNGRAQEKVYRLARA